MIIRFALTFLAVVFIAVTTGCGDTTPEKKPNTPAEPPPLPGKDGPKLPN